LLLPQDAPPPSLPPAAAETVGLPGPAWAPPPPRRGHRKPLIAALASVALLAVAGAAYGTYAWLTHRHHAPASAGSAGSPPPVSPSGSPAAGNGTVAVAPAVARNPGAQPVVNLLTSYFTAINTHDYRAYSRLIDQRLRNGLTPARFQAGYGSTTDSRATLTGISTAADGRVTAAVTFTSHQRPEDGPDHSACTLWNITLFLEPQNDGFVLGPAPPGYHASHQPC